jgi:cell division protein FtsA
VVNIEATVDAISRVIQEVELMAECKIRDVYTGIAGSHIRSFNSNGMVAIKDKEVSPSTWSGSSRPPGRCRCRPTSRSCTS